MRAGGPKGASKGPLPNRNSNSIPKLSDGPKGWANTLSSSSFVGEEAGVARGRSLAVFASASGHVVGSMKYSFIYNSQQRIDSCAAAPTPAPARKSRFKLNL